MIEIQLPRTPSLFDSLWSWLKVVQQISFGTLSPRFTVNSEESINGRVRTEGDPTKEALLRECKIEQLEDELIELQRVLTATNSPVCFCHNDLLGGNIMYNEQTERLAFIDYEYGSYNFRGSFLSFPFLSSLSLGTDHSRCDVWMCNVNRFRYRKSFL